MSRNAFYPVFLIIYFFFQYHAICPAHRVDSENLVLKHSVPHFAPIFSRHCVLSGETQRQPFILMLKRKNGNIQFSQMGIEPTTRVYIPTLAPATCLKH